MSSPTSTNLSVLTRFFECPVCFDYTLPPIHQCASGHLVCSNCRPRLVDCPTCRGPLGNIRNLGMEKVADLILFPCKYSTGGCGDLLVHTDKLEHEVSCDFRPYACPCPGSSCKWQGTSDQIIPHIKADHSSVAILHGEDIVLLATDIALPGAGSVDWIMVQACYGHHFMVVLHKHSKSSVEQFLAFVQFIGSKGDAEKFNYKLELNSSALKQKLTWESGTQSIHASTAHIIGNLDCLKFDKNIAQKFAVEGNLSLNVMISMKQDQQVQLEVDENKIN